MRGSRACRAWRALAKEWMAALTLFKSLKGVHRWKELRSAVALQLLASDPSLQQAALKCLKVRAKSKCQGHTILILIPFASLLATGLKS